MTEEAAVQHWVEGADRMLRAAKNSLASQDYEVALFSCHLAVEKMLKAKYIATHHDAPPKTHNLEKRCALVGIQIFEEEINQLDELTKFAGFARYGSDTWLDAEATQKNCEKWFELTNSFLQAFHP